MHSVSASPMNPLTSVMEKTPTSASLTGYVVISSHCERTCVREGRIMEMSVSSWLRVSAGNETGKSFCSHVSLILGGAG